jgi:methylenetetrahydrofolate dehydrogenase (NADP+)/methenyltetrahydrofolate cyclohydrolase
MANIVLGMKQLNGSELAGFIKERQAKQVRALIQARGVVPKLAIVLTKNNDPVIEVYMKLKTKYGNDILVDVDIHRIKQADVATVIAQLNADPLVHGIIVQLPLEDTSQTDEVVELVTPNKDVDALGSKAAFEPATPLAIMWLLAGYNVDLTGKQVLLIGRGKLVGAPLERILKSSGVNVQVADRKVKDLQAETLKADVIVTATGTPGVLTAEMIKLGAVVVDAGVASESGKTVGDLDADVYERDDLTVTPVKGGVGPLTVCALFENVIKAAKQVD